MTTMNAFKKIFERHFFSNHHIEAKQVEARLEQLYSGCQCVVVSGFAALIVSAIDELCDNDLMIYSTSSSDELTSQISNTNKFLNATNRRQVIILSETDFSSMLAQSKYLKSELNCHAVLFSQDEIMGIFSDLSKLHDNLISAGLFVTHDVEMAEKIRWARSSYGRLGHATIRIAANSRFSEFQGSMINNGLDKMRFD
jgi:hypothetical protein